MFSRTSNTQPPLQPKQPQRPNAPSKQPIESESTLARRPGTKPVSLLAADLLFEGNISGDGELIIDGAVKGDIHVAHLVIGEHAHVEGTIRGGQIEVRGHVQGNIEAIAVRLLESAHVEGDITHERLSIDVGAFYQGRCSQLRPAAQQAPTPHAALPEPAASVIELDQAAQM